MNIKKVPNAIPFYNIAQGKARVPAPTVAAINDKTEPDCPPGLNLNDAYLTGVISYMKN